MKKILLTIFIPIILIFSIVATAGFIKFNYFDVPYFGEPLTYVSNQGAPIVVSGRVDGSIRLDLPNDPRIIMTQQEIDSDTEYVNNKKQLTFLRNDKTFVVSKAGEILYQGTTKLISSKN